MDDSPSKRSSIVTLTLVGLPLGAVAFANLAPSGPQMQRRLYRDQAACESDYRPSQCQANSSGGGWHGPYYYADRSMPQAKSDPGTGRTTAVVPTESSYRGGFGRIARFASARAGT